MSDQESHNPPGWICSFFRWFCKSEYQEDIEGDLLERFEDRIQNQGVKTAKRLFILDVLRLFRPGLIKSISGIENLNHFAMYKNYFKIGWRNIIKRKAHSAINIFGLGLGMACCLIIFLFVQNELSYDTYHENGERIYRVTHGSRETDDTTEGTSESFWVWGNAPVGPLLQEYFPEIDKVLQFSGRSDILLRHESNVYQEEGVFFMDSTVFDVFSWELLEGDPETALIAPFSIVLTESTARKYFGNEDALGKTLNGSESAGRSMAGEYKVTGIMADIPSNSHFRFNALLSLSTFRTSIPEVFDLWGYVDFYTYFLTNEHFNEINFNKKIPEFIAAYNDPDSKYTIAIEPLRDVYLRTPAQRQPGQTGSLSNVYMFSIIGLFILGIAMINFMNLSTARSIERGKEVGIRKSIGANRGSLISQFMGESYLMVALAMLVAILAAFVASLYMSDFTGKAISVQQFYNWRTILYVIGAILLIGIIAGAYPALVLSAFNPVLVLKGIISSNGGSANLRRGLVILQFSLSIGLIAGTIIVYTQMKHVLDKETGFDKDRMLILDYNYDEAVNNQMEVLRSELEANAAIQSVAFSRSVPGSYFPNANTEVQDADGAMQMMVQPIFQVGMDFISHFGLEVVAGRSYSNAHPSDSSGALVVNEAAARQYGYTNPADIVGKRFSQWGREGKVIGVLKDFNYISLHRNIEPLTLPFVPYASRYLSVKISSQDLNRTIEDVEGIWSTLIPHRPYLYSFLDEDFDRQYHADFMFRKLFTTFSSLAIFIACLGLLGLATYATKQRTKEIGIRKALGASAQNIMVLLSKDFINLVLISVAIATPMAWYFMNRWLEGFAYRMDIRPWIFVLAGLIALIIAICTISYQSVKSALMNPVTSLRSD